MCRLLAKTSKHSGNLSYLFFKADKPFTSLSKRHHDGWGIGWYKNNKPKLYKEGLDEVKKYSFEKAKTINSDILIAHLRKASAHINGYKIQENTHPFIYKKYIFAHNGSFDHKKVMKYLKTKYKKLIKGNTDSEVYFLLLMQNLEKSMDIVKALKNTLLIIKKYAYRGLNFLLSDGKTLYAYRDASVKFSYYTLYYIIKKDEILICSTPLTKKDDWKLIKLKELLIINKNLDFKIIEIN